MCVCVQHSLSEAGVGSLEFFPASPRGLGSGFWRQLLLQQERSRNRTWQRKGVLSSEAHESQGLQLEAVKHPMACSPGLMAPPIVWVGSGCLRGQGPPWSKPSHGSPSLGEKDKVFQRPQVSP